MRYLENLHELAYSVSLHANTPLDSALNLKRGFAEKFFESKAYKDSVKIKEAEHKLMAAALERIDVVNKSIGGFGKALASIFRGR